MLLNDVSSYREFRDALAASNCQCCDLSKSRTQIVVDRGNPKSRVLIVGEAPGKNEDLTGRPFVGRSGRLLDDMLMKLGFDTNKDALVVNIAKCRPPKNRPPRPEEVKACLPYLWKQIKIVNPRLIMLMGATALKHIFPERKAFAMAEQAGRFFDHASLPGARWVALFHPAYILRDPRKKPLMEKHLENFVDDWRKKAPEARCS